MKKIIILTVFIIGLGIFSYPIISNFFSSKEHHTIVSEYNQTIKKMEDEQLEKEKEKVEKHNESLAQSEVDFVDPFSNNNLDEIESGQHSYYDALNIGPAIGSVMIPKIDVELPIYHGTDEKVLSRGVGHLENSSLPSAKLGTHTVLTAHRGLSSAKMFRNLDELTIGDQFYVQVLNETLLYEIHDINVVLPHETDWLQMDEDKNIVTLLTCDPYMFNTHRLLVTGHLIPHDQAKEQQANVINHSDNDVYWIGAAILATIAFGIWFRRRHKKDKGENR
ncbi:class C sortase [Lederbergia lenta]|uniref:Sortase family protein n=1 Tax=Lederbergia lenta TaxID=1467 RepID=A0A2X4WSW9_LEDLE|nr:class C sortase [Lederbergia lenta]MEC2323113.1 class C sortase [Lederbergia lenta]SQI62748.1 sortase family protein [Lederbergia lenta]